MVHKPPYEGWELVAETFTEAEAQMITEILRLAEIDSAVMSTKVPMYTVNIGKMGMVRIYVPADDLERAKEALAEAQAAGEEMEP